MKSNRLNPQRGVSMVEFAIVFPVAVLFVLSLNQVGFFYMAKSTLNHATFMAARAGALNHANPDVIKAALTRGLSLFYQDATIDNDFQRLALAYGNPDLTTDSAYSDVYVPVP